MVLLRVKAWHGLFGLVIRPKLIAIFLIANY